MPTDPFVAPELDDRPRQQQNLAPGVAYPPSRRAKPARPGELGPGQPAGPLFGSPGPNIGYALTLAERTHDRLRLAPHEHEADAVAVVAEIAMKRAALFGRAPVVGDVDVAAAILGYDGSADKEFADLRSTLVHEAHHDYGVRRSIVDSVPEGMLRLKLTELGPRIADWRAVTLRGEGHGSTPAVAS